MYPLFDCQLDGNHSVTDSSIDDLNTSNSPHPNPSQSPRPESPSSPCVPGLLHDINLTLSSLSLDSHPDLDNFLPFDVTSTPSPQLSQPRPPDSPDTPDHPGMIQHNIPVVCNNREVQRPPKPRTPVRRTIRRDNRAVTALSLPNIMVTNHRSLFPKFNNLVDEILENDMHLGIHSEVWEDKENINHAQSIEKALELQGIQYISTPRPNRRGGGVAITLISDSPFVLSKLDTPTASGSDQSLEVCWGLVKPRNPTGNIKSLIVCAFYLPPRSKKKSALVEHISLTYFSLKPQYPDSAFVCGGDKNDLNTQLLLNIDPSFHQIVTKPTYKQTILDILVTDIGQYYHVPTIRPPVLPDNPTTASPSDHMIVFSQANTSSFQPVQRVTSTVTVRPLPADAIQGLAQWIQHESWTFVYDGRDVSDMVDRFNFITNLNLDHYCPTKVLKISNLDGKISSAKVKQTCRQKKREYAKNGNSAKYKELKKLVKIHLKDAAIDFLSKQVKLTTSANKNWLKHVKRIAARPGDLTSNTFTLPQHVEDGLSALESSNKICEFFSSISQEYSPLCVARLPERVRAKLINDQCQHPYLSDHLVYEGLRKGKKTCSVPGDLPIKILNEFLPELVSPIAAIYREAISSHTWPKPYKKEHHLPINKTPLPKSEDDLRNLGLTPFFSKRLEWFVIQWIWPYIEPHIDLDQLGGLPGCSVNHYLIQMLDFIYSNLDNTATKPTAIVCALVDFSKAFNRIDHNVIVTILSDLNIPTCALRHVMSYLSNRRMCVRYNGAVSGDQAIPGGGPQGGLLTVLLFNLQVNVAGAPCPLLKSLPPGIHGPEPQQAVHGPLLPCQQVKKTKKKKYVDDLSMLEAIDLKVALVPSPTIIGPPNRHEVPCLSLPAENSVLQHQLADLANFTFENKMKINQKKTKIIPFNFSKKYDFLPQLNFPGCDYLEVIYETQLLGITLTSDLSWSTHVDNITRRATKTLWVLIRFKQLGGTRDQLSLVYQTRIRSVLEFAAPVFHGNLTCDQSRQIESTQKKALAIILGSEYVCYESALTILKLERLDLRRTRLCYTFALKCTKSTKHAAMFPLNKTPIHNTRHPKKYLEPTCNTSRYYNSSIPYMTRLLNNPARLG